jgi:hypothetical protein
MGCHFDQREKSCDSRFLGNSSSTTAPALFYYTPSMVLCVALLHAIHGIMHYPTFCIIHMEEVVNADIARSNISALAVVPPVEMTAHSIRLLKRALNDSKLLTQSVTKTISHLSTQQYHHLILQPFAL